MKVILIFVSLFFFFSSGCKEVQTRLVLIDLNDQTVKLSEFRFSKGDSLDFIYNNALCRVHFLGIEELNIFSQQTKQIDLQVYYAAEIKLKGEGIKAIYLNPVGYFSGLTPHGRYQIDLGKIKRAGIEISR